MVSYHSETTQHYNETMENLKIINETIAYLLQVAHLSVFLFGWSLLLFPHRSQILIANFSVTFKMVVFILKIVSVARIVPYTSVFHIKRWFYR